MYSNVTVGGEMRGVAVGGWRDFCLYETIIGLAKIREH